MSDLEIDIQERLEPEELRPAVPHDGGYGWIIVASCFVLNAFTWGVTAVGVFMLHNFESSRLTNQKPSSLLGSISPNTSLLKSLQIPDLWSLDSLVDSTLAVPCCLLLQLHI